MARFGNLFALTRMSKPLVPCNSRFTGLRVIGDDFCGYESLDDLILQVGPNEFDDRNRNYTGGGLEWDDSWPPELKQGLPYRNGHAALFQELTEDQYYGVWLDCAHPTDYGVYEETFSSYADWAAMQAAGWSIETSGDATVLVESVGIGNAKRVTLTGAAGTRAVLTRTLANLTPDQDAYVAVRTQTISGYTTYGEGLATTSIGALTSLRFGSSPSYVWQHSGWVEPVRPFPESATADLTVVVGYEAKPDGNTVQFYLIDFRLEDGVRVIRDSWHRTTFAHSPLSFGVSGFSYFYLQQVFGDAGDITVGIQGATAFNGNGTTSFGSVAAGNLFITYENVGRCVSGDCAYPGLSWTTDLGSPAGLFDEDVKDVITRCRAVPGGGGIRIEAWAGTAESPAKLFDQTYTQTAHRPGVYYDWAWQEYWSFEHSVNNQARWYELYEWEVVDSRLNPNPYGLA